MELLYKTVILSRRHLKVGYCEDKDFGEITLIRTTEEEAPLICNIKDYKLNQTLRLFKGYYYSDWDKWDNQFYFKEKQGKLTDKTVVALMVKLREKEDSPSKSFSYVPRYKYIIVGKRIYKRWCKKSELYITQCGNMMFSSWWTVDIETMNPNKSHVRFNKKNFEKELKDARKYYNERRGKRGDNHDSFSCPIIKWFNEYLI